MRALLPAAVAAVALSAAAPDHARAAPSVRLDFTGSIDFIRPGVNGPLDGFVEFAPGPKSAVDGYVLYDAGTPATAPGVWNLPTATYHATFGDLTFDVTGLIAVATGANASAFEFRFAIPPGEFPTPVTAADGFLGVQTFRDDAFDRFTLPTAIPDGDQVTGFAYTTPGGVDGAVNTFLRITSTAIPAPTGVPEPASFAPLGLGLAGLAFARRRARG